MVFEGKKVSIICFEKYKFKRKGRKCGLFSDFLLRFFFLKVIWVVVVGWGWGEG